MIVWGTSPLSLMSGYRYISALTGRVFKIRGQRIFPVGMMGKALAHIRHIE